MSKHAVVHIEIPSTDPKASAAFYEALFGWKMETDDKFEYTMFVPAEGPGGGFTKIDGDRTKPGDIAVYVDTDDIPATLAKAESLGAATAVPETEIPGMGTFAFFVDPSGNKIALWHTANPGA